MKLNTTGSIVWRLLALITLCVYTEGIAFLDLSLFVNVEEGVNFTVCVNLTEPESESATVTVETSIVGEAQKNIDFRLENGDSEIQLVFNPGDLRQCTFIEMLTDDIVESGELFQVGIESDIGIDIARQSSLITILDRSRLTVEFTEQEYTINEGAVAISVCVNITEGQIARNVNFRVITSTTTVGTNPAISGVDFVQANESRTFTPTATVQCAPITVNEDDLIEPPETIRVTLTTSDAVIPTDTTVVIEDNDGVTMSIGTSDTFVFISEGNSGLTPVDVCITLIAIDGSLLRSIPINLTTVVGSALANEDFEAIFDEQWEIPSTIQVGERVCHSVNVIGDDLREPSENFQVQLEPGNIYDTITIPNVVRITIQDDGDTVFQCPVLNPIPRGDVTTDPPDRRQGAVATYTCDAGFELDGSGTRNCNAEGQWTGTEPGCQIVDCGTPPMIDQATVEYTATTYQSQALYMCESGYEFSNGQLSFIRECLITGEWSNLDNAPTCELVDCDTPPAIANSTMQFTDTTFQSEAIYTCDAGFGFDGGEATFDRSCLDTGSWSNLNDAPQCLPVNCSTPPSIALSTAEFTATTFQSQVTYTCETGYIFSNGELTFTRTCEATEMWSNLDNAPVCEITTCEELLVDNGEVTYSDELRGINSTATTTCDELYILEGNTDERICGEDGEWSGTDAFCNPQRTTTLGITPESEDNTNMVIAIAVGVGGGALLLIVVASVVVIVLLLIRRKKIYRKYVLPYRTYIYSTPRTSVRTKQEKPAGPLRDNDITIFENDTRQHAVDAVEALDKDKPKQ